MAPQNGDLLFGAVVLALTRQALVIPIGVRARDLRRVRGGRTYRRGRLSETEESSHGFIQALTIVCPCPRMASPKPNRKTPPIHKKPRRRFTPAGAFFLIGRLPTLPHTRACSTIGAVGLNFRVRDGNGWDPLATITQKLIRSRAPLAEGALARFSAPERLKY